MTFSVFSWYKITSLVLQSIFIVKYWWGGVENNPEQKERIATLILAIPQVPNL